MPWPWLHFIEPFLVLTQVHTESVQRSKLQTTLHQNVFCAFAHWFSSPPSQGTWDTLQGQGGKESRSSTTLSGS